MLKLLVRSKIKFFFMGQRITIDSSKFQFIYHTEIEYKSGAMEIRCDRRMIEIMSGFRSFLYRSQDYVNRKVISKSLYPNLITFCISITGILSLPFPFPFSLPLPLSLSLSLPFSLPLPLSLSLPLPLPLFHSHFPLPLHFPPPLSSSFPPPF